MTGQTGFIEIPKERSLIAIPKETQQNWKNKAIFYPQLKSLIQTYGLWEVNCYQLSKEWGISDSTVYRWKDAIIEELEGENDFDNIAKSLKLNSIANIKAMQRLIRETKNPKIKIVAIKVQSELIEKFTNFCEAYGIKEKVSDKLEITSKSISLIINDSTDKYPDIEVQSGK